MQKRREIVTDSTLEHFSKTLYEAAKLSGTTVYTITRPIYLNMCKIHNLDGWTKDQIQSYDKGWAGLRKDALRETKNENSGQYDFSVHWNTVVDNAEDDYEVGMDEEAEEDTEETIFPNDEREKYLASYSRFVKTHHYAPTMSIFRKWYGSPISRAVYDNIYDLDEDYRCLCKEEAKKNLFDKYSWNDEYKDAFRKEVKKHKTFVLTSIGSFCEVNWDFIRALENYSKENNAMLIGLPLFRRCGKSVTDFSTDSRLNDVLWLPFEDVKLNNNLMVQVIKASCTAKSTITGLNQIVAKYDSSIIAAGINQQLRYIPVLKHKTPNMIASTGCATYYTPIKRGKCQVPTKAEKLASERTSIMGALVVELGDNDTFTVRNLEADENGNVIDLGVMYGKDSVEPVDESTFIIGDLHAPQHNAELLQSNIEAIKNYGCRAVVLHDGVNMTYISHHNADQAITRAQLVEEGSADILVEVTAFANVLRQLTEIETVEEVIIPYSNHPAHFDKFIQDIGRMAKDDINLRTSLMTALAMLDDKNTLQYLVEEVVKFKNDKLRWISEDTGVEHYGVQVGLHGSERVNGGRMTSTSTNNAFRKTVLAHKHSAGIDGDTITVGIACEKDQGYNHGLSSWTESSAIVYPNGTVQLLTFVNVKGEYILWL